MKELLREWKRFLNESDGDRDIQLSDDAYGMLVLMYLGNFDTDPNLKKKRFTFLKERTSVFLPFAQIEQAEREATELRKNLTKFLKTYLPPEEKKNLTTTQSGWKSSPNHSSVRDIFWSRANIFAKDSEETKGNKNIHQAFDIGHYYTHLYKMITVPPSFTGADLKDAMPMLQKEIDVVNKESEGAYELLEKIRLYNRAFNIQDDEDKTAIARLLFSGAHNPENLMQAEELIQALT